MSQPVRSIAIISSFRKMMNEVARASRTFSGAGFEVTSPRHDAPLDPDVEFVRFESDHGSDHLVQTVALHRIMGADLVYVVAVDGYVGRTTCYEIGRILQSGQPLIFSERPRDLPIFVDDRSIMSPGELVRLLALGEDVSAVDGAADNRDLEMDLRHLNFRKI